MPESEVVIICPVCDEDTTLTYRDFVAALRHRKETNGIPIGSCLKCHSAFELPDTMPNAGTELEAWIVKASEDPEDWCPCIPLLDRRQGDSPVGHSIDAGLKTYVPGDGTKPLPKWQYMAVHGLNPETYLAANPDMGGEPVKVGTPAKKKVKK